MSAWRIFCKHECRSYLMANRFLNEEALLDLPMWLRGLSIWAPCTIEHGALSGQGSNLILVFLEKHTVPN